MDLNLRSSYDAGICYNKTSESQTLTLALVNPSNWTLARVAECRVPSDPSEEALVDVLATLAEGPIAMSALAIPRDMDVKLYNTLRQSASKAGLSLGPPDISLAEAACYTLPSLSQGESTTVLCVHVDEGEKLSYAGLVTVSQNSELSRSLDVSPAVIEHVSNVGTKELVRLLISPLKQSASHIMLVPSAPASVLDDFATIIRTEDCDLPILQPTQAEIAHGIAIKATIYARYLHRNYTATPFLGIPVGIVTANGHIVNVAFAGGACPIDRTVTLRTAKDGQTTVSVPLIAGALGDEVGENNNTGRVRETVTLSGLILPPNGRALVRVRILVKRSYDVAVSVEQADAPNGPSVIVQCPALLRKKELSKEYDEMYRSNRQTEVEYEDGEIVGELSE